MELHTIIFFYIIHGKKAKEKIFLTENTIVMYWNIIFKKIFEINKYMLFYITDCVMVW